MNAQGGDGIGGDARRFGPRVVDIPAWHLPETACYLTRAGAQTSAFTPSKASGYRRNVLPISHASI